LELSSYYKVKWTDGNITGSSSQSETNITISNLTAGVQYEIDVSAVAGDNETKGKATAVSVYTSKLFSSSASALKSHTVPFL